MVAAGALLLVAWCDERLLSADDDDVERELERGTRIEVVRPRRKSAQSAERSIFALGERTLHSVTLRVESVALLRQEFASETGAQNADSSQKPGCIDLRESGLQQCPRRDFSRPQRFEVEGRASQF